jgi:hypothetical protein
MLVQRLIDKNVLMREDIHIATLSKMSVSEFVSISTLSFKTCFKHVLNAGMC